MVAVDGGRFETATRLLAAAAAWRGELATPAPPRARAVIERALAAARAELGPSRLSAAWAAGAGLSIEQSTTEAERVGTAPDGAAMPGAVPARPGPSLPWELSPRELEVLRLLAAGRTNREIAAALFIGHRTATSHVASILGKLGVSTRSAAAALAVRHGLG